MKQKEITAALELRKKWLSRTATTLSNLRGIVNMKYIAKETGIDNTNLHYIITGRKKSGFTEDEARKVGQVLSRIADMCNGCTGERAGYYE